MVGPPKNLSDLDRIEADVRITCRACGWEIDWSVPELRTSLLASGGNTTWTQITRGMICGRPRCRSTNLYPLAVPFAQRAPNAPIRLLAIDRAIIAAALAILEEAARRSNSEPVATPAVRLALYATHRYHRDDELTRRYWEAAQMSGTYQGQNCHQPLAWIQQRMERQGLVSPRD